MSHDPHGDCTGQAGCDSHNKARAQLWFCQSCGTVGALMVRPGEDVMSVVYRMGDQHTGVSPDCGKGAMMLQSIVPENIREDQVLCLPVKCVHDAVEDSK